MKLHLAELNCSRGAPMGRRNTLPNDLPDGDWKAWGKLHLVRVPFVDSAYDQGGAYWGMPSNLWVATEGAKSWSPLKKRWELIPCGVTVFVRGDSRAVAKANVWEIVPECKFYR